jgi:hypothetical protein
VILDHVRPVVPVTKSCVPADIVQTMGELAEKEGIVHQPDDLSPIAIGALR